MADEDVATNEAIGKFGFDLISRVARLKAGMPVHILTHCNAGWLATVDRGTATAPIYMAHDAGIPLHLREVKGPVMDRLKDTDFLRHLGGQVFLTHYQAVQSLVPDMPGLTQGAAAPMHAAPAPA